MYLQMNLFLNTRNYVINEIIFQVNTCYRITFSDHRDLVS